MLSTVCLAADNDRGGGNRTVAVAFHEPVIGGSAIAVLRILPLLEARGWRFTFWTPGPGQLRSELERRGYRVAGEVRLLRYSRAGLRVRPGPAERLARAPSYLRHFRRWVRQESPALLHANTVITVPEGVVARTCGVPVFLYVHEILPRGPKGAAAAGLIRASAHQVLTNSATSLHALRRQHVRAELAHYGTEVPHAPSRKPANRPVVVGSLGNISHRKGSDVFLAAAELVGRELPRVEFRMIGPCPDGVGRAWAEQLVARANERGVKCGTTNDAFSELAEWDVLVLASRSEPFGLVLIEAMAMGLPVVATRIDGPREIVTPDTGLLVDVADERGLADAIIELATDQDRRLRMGAAGRARVERHFKLERQAEAVDRAYRQAVSEMPQRRRARRT
jgi:glycosyltransferase involved in cell wall biosynthesis